MIGVNCKPFTEEQRAEQIALENQWLGYCQLESMPDHTCFVVKDGCFHGIGWLGSQDGVEDRGLFVQTDFDSDGADYFIPMVRPCDVQFILANFSTESLPRQYYSV